MRDCRNKPRSAVPIILLQDPGVPDQILTNKNAVIYVRVSSKEQEREGYSIPAQLKLLRSYALKNNLIVVKTFVDVETAKQVGRTYFAKMLSFLQDHQAVKIILSEKTDRLYRNFRDYVTIDDLDLTVILVKEGSILNKNSTSHDKFIHGIKVLMAKNYIDNLSEETIKGLTVKAEKGEFPNQPPLGYVLKDKKIYVDQKTALLIKDIFEHFASGAYTTRSITEYAWEIGLTSRKGNKPSRSSIHSMLKNPFYYGDFIWGGQLYHGIHFPIISKELYNKVHEVFENKGRGPQQKHHYAYNGLLRCADCGCAITAEAAKQKYIYYHCTFSKGRHNDIYVREEVLEAQYAAILRKLHLSISQVNRFAELFKIKREERFESLRTEKRRLQQKHKLLERRIDSAVAARLEQKIDVEDPQPMASKSHFNALIRRISSDLPSMIRMSLSFITKLACGTNIKFSGTFSLMAMMCTLYLARKFRSFRFFPMKSFGGPICIRSNSSASGMKSSMFGWDNPLDTRKAMSLSGWMISVAPTLLRIFAWSSSRALASIFLTPISCR